MLFSVPRHFILIFESDYGGVKLPEGGGGGKAKWHKQNYKN